MNSPRPLPWLFLVAALLLLSPRAARAGAATPAEPAPSAPAEASGETRFTLGTDVTPWWLEGFSVLASVEPSAAPRLRLTAEVWAMRLPGFAVDLAESNRGAGFSHRVTLSGALYADLALGGAGLHAGLLANVQRARIARQGAGSETLPVAELLARVGWRLLPFGDTGLAIDPWVGVGPQLPLARLPELGGARYALFPAQLLATVHLGYRF